MVYIEWYRMGNPYTWIGTMMDTSRWGYAPPANGMIVDSGTYYLPFYWGNLVGGVVNCYKPSTNQEITIVVSWDIAKIYY